MRSEPGTNITFYIATVLLKKDICETVFVTFDFRRVSRTDFIQLRTGFLTSIQAILRLKEDSLLHSGVPCSSFTWLNRGTSGRRSDNPTGDLSQPSVRHANKSLDSMGELQSKACTLCYMFHCLLTKPLDFPKDSDEIYFLHAYRNCPLYSHPGGAASVEYYAPL